MARGLLAWASIADWLNHVALCPKQIGRSLAKLAGTFPVCAHHQLKRPTFFLPLFHNGPQQMFASTLFIQSALAETRRAANLYNGVLPRLPACALTSLHGLHSCDVTLRVTLAGGFEGRPYDQRFVLGRRHSRYATM